MFEEQPYLSYSKLLVLTPYFSQRNLDFRILET